MVRRIVVWMRSEQGQDLIEYSMLAGLIAGALIVVSMVALTGAVHGMGDGIAECIDWDGINCAV